MIVLNVYRNQYHLKVPQIHIFSPHNSLQLVIIILAFTHLVIQQSVEESIEDKHISHTSFLLPQVNKTHVAIDNFIVEPLLGLEPFH